MQAMLWNFRVVRGSSIALDKTSIIFLTTKYTKKNKGQDTDGGVRLLSLARVATDVADYKPAPLFMQTTQRDFTADIRFLLVACGAFCHAGRDVLLQGDCIKRFRGI
ncbi:MAG: hypothetical protein ACOC54_04400 [Candidatus Sumerlaeota bacterium]